MYEPKLKKYQKKFEYSYSFGIYPTLDLIKYRRDSVYKVLIKSKTDGSKGIDEIKSLCEEYGIPVEVQDKAIDKIAFKDNTYVVGVFKKYELELEKETNHMVLVEPRNMGNLGTIIRTMLGFGVTNLAIVNPATDIFDPKVVRSTMGAVFQINFKYFDSFREYLNENPNQHVYPFMLNGAKDIRDVKFEKPFSIVQGNESKGLPDEFKEFGQSVFIPHGDGIDSLNLSIATGISLWESSKIK
jgi:TrmH family RNA methyltransferase